MDITAQNPFPINGSHANLLAYQKLITAIMELGEIEHTSDWDPFLIITTKSKLKSKTIETLSGYPDMLINPTHIQVHITESDDQKLTSIPIADILTIKLLH